MYVLLYFGHISRGRPLHSARSNAAFRIALRGCEYLEHAIENNKRYIAAHCSNPMR